MTCDVRHVTCDVRSVPCDWCSSRQVVDGNSCAFFFILIDIVSVNCGGSENDICIRWQQHRVRGKGGGAVRGLGDCGGGGGGRMQLQTGTEGATAACNRVSA